MGRLRQQLSVTGTKGTDQFLVLFDSGATQTYIRRDVAERIGDLHRLPKPQPAKLADGETEFVVTEAVTVLVQVGDKEMTWDAHVADRLSHDLIVGARMMQAYHVLLDFKNDRIITEQIDTAEAIG